MTAIDHIAAGDCERCRPGPIAQPANVASSLAYVVVGLMIAKTSRRGGSRRGGSGEALGGRRGRRTESAIGWAAISAGLGSVAYHGPGTAAGRYVHDASLLALVTLVAVADVELASGREASSGVLAAVPALAAVAAHPRASMVAQALGGAAAVGGEVARLTFRDPTGHRRTGPRRWRVAVALVAAAGAVAHVGGRTGGPWCRPNSLLQPHAAWHVATATAIWLRSLDLRDCNIGAAGLDSESPRGVRTR